MNRSLVRLGVLAGAAIALAGCSTYGNHRGYGYSGVSIGYATSRPYYGWYDGYYYPGTGYYVYDRQGSRHRWRDTDRRRWDGNREGRRGRDNWSGNGRARPDRDHRRSRR